MIAFQRIVAPKLMGLKADEAAIAAALPNAHRVFDALAHELGDQPYFVGGAVSLADVLLVPQLDFFAATTWERVSAMARAS